MVSVTLLMPARINKNDTEEELKIKGMDNFRLSFRRPAPTKLGAGIHTFGSARR